MVCGGDSPKTARAASRVKLPFDATFGWCATLAAVAALGSCGTDAEGIATCRRIETIRCEAAPACPDHFDIVTEQDVEACTQFYRDQCLHGLQRAVDPGDPAAQACFNALETVSQCARDGVASLGECSGPQGAVAVTLAADAAAPPCDAIATPERLLACAFLADPPPNSDAGTNATPDVDTTDVATTDADDGAAGDAGVDDAAAE